jgi:hypothetical protein
MNWRNPFLTTYLAVTVVGAGILGYMLYSSMSHYDEVDASYTDAVDKLNKLQNRHPFPNEENYRKYEAYTADYRAAYQQLLGQLNKMQKPLEAITPQTFQDRLRAYVSEVMATGQKNGVEFEPGFYLGFDQYRDTLPSNEASAPLARELEGIRALVGRLVDLKVHKILGVKRTLLPEEGGAAQSAPTPQQRPGRPALRMAQQPASDVITVNPFEIAFVSDQARFRQAVNSITQADQFLVLRTLNVVNSNTEGPKRAEDASAEQQPAATPAPDQAADLTGANAAAPVSHMRLLVGRETLTVAARIEMLTFNLPASK